MSMPQPELLFTVDQYLARERAAEERHEYLDGHIIAMAGESLNHGIISVNLVGSLHPQLRGTPCLALTKDSKVRSGPVPMLGRSTRGLFSYPDVVVVCDEPEFHDSYRDVILNPRVLFEVLSPGTEAFDRGAKFDRYQSFTPTLSDYVLVSQDRACVEHYHRQADGGWMYHRHVGLEAALRLESIGCTLRLADVYDRARFPEIGGD